MDSEESGIKKEQVWHVGLLKYRKISFVSLEMAVFPISRIYSICLFISQMSSSNANQVSLKKIPLHLSGKFRCEVSTEAPLFTTMCSEDELTVLGKPD